MRGEARGDITFDIGMRDDLPLAKKREIARSMRNAEYVDYYAPPEIMDKMGHLHTGKDGYVVSGINSHDKFSDLLAGCTGIIAVGTNKETRKNISFAAHQSPEALGLGVGSLVVDYSPTRNKFKQDLSQRLSELRTMAEPKTVRIAVFGGMVHESELANYKQNMDAVAALVHELVGLHPSLIKSPNRAHAELEGYANEFTDVLFTNKQRHLYILKHVMRYRRPMEP